MHVEVKRCKYCAETFSTDKKLLKHARKNHEASSKVNCGNCNTPFKTKKSLSVHKAKQICKAITNKSTIQFESNNSDRDGEEISAHQGPIIGCAGTSKNSLEIFKCDKCPKKYISERGHRGHLLKHKAVSVQPSLVLNDCEESEEQLVYYDEAGLDILKHGIEGSDFFVVDT